MPSVADRMKRKKRKVLIVPANDRLDKVEPKICVIAPMTTIPGDKNPARMAASPRISPPTTVTVEPTAEGNQIPASRRISKKRSAINISTATSKGIPNRLIPKVASDNRAADLDDRKEWQQKMQEAVAIRTSQVNEAFDQM